MLGKNPMKKYRLALLLLPILALSCALFTLATKGRSHAKVNGKLSVKGIEKSLIISRDEFGVPHIRAENEHDAFFALGFTHAQDRLFQMDLLRRFTYGKISEWLGSDSAQIDLFMRGLDFSTRANDALLGADPKLSEAVRAYCDGVNEGAKSLKTLPPEYRLLKVGFEPWQPQDSLAVIYLNSWNLATNPGAEMLAFLLRKKLDSAALNALVHWDKESPIVDSYWDTLRNAEVGEFTKSATSFLRFMGISVKPAASNNWVVGPEKSADGFPIVANDPHLSQQVPSLWYVVDVKGGDFHAAGATFPGSPFVLTGHNETLAWGVTNTMADYIDFALVERSGDDGYILAGTPKKLKKLPLTVKVKDKADATGEVYWTEIGPVLTALSGTHLLVMQWHAFMIKDESGALFYGLNHSKTVEEALQAIKKPSLVSQNLVLADTKKDFAWQVFGSVVKRRNFSGRVPYPASDPNYGWDFFTELPGERAPSRGFIQTANSKPVWPEANAITTDYVPGWRFTRIGERLSEKNKVSADDMRALQLDVTDVFARTRLPGLLEGVNPASGPAKQCYDILKSWDYNASKTSIGNTVWIAFVGELSKEALLDDLGEDGYKIFSRVISDSNSIFDELLQFYLPDRAKGVEKALGAACQRLSKDLGADTKGWQWGKTHSLVLTHPFADQSKLLSDWSMPKAGIWGNDSTVSVAGTDRNSSTTETPFIPSIRLVTPLSDVSKATFIYPGGQSGQPESKHYKDLFQTYVAGETVPLYFSDKDVDEKATEVLTLSKK
jgi:penicillin amidase